jgi:hypothetical protein
MIDCWKEGLLEEAQPFSGCPSSPAVSLLGIVGFLVFSIPEETRAHPMERMVS